jgi:glycosyltransferase involved in cell wall biosynthesis
VQYPTQGYGRGLLPSLVPLLARIAGIGTVQTWHEGFGRRYAFKLLLQLSARSRQIVVRSNFIDLVHPALRGPVTRSNPVLIANASAIPRSQCTREEQVFAKRSLLQGQSRLIVFFGFLQPTKGVEQVFDIANPATDHIVIAGPAEDESPYLESLKRLADGASWKGRVTFTGFLSPERAALILSVADAVILPFRQGSGPWNTSIHSATLNDAFVITTAPDPIGYDASRNIYYALPNDVEDMRSALAAHSGRPIDLRESRIEFRDDWADIAQKHYRIYESRAGGVRC